LRRALERAEVGEVVELLADDPMARIDVPHFAREAGHEVVSVEEDGAVLRFKVRKAKPSPPAGEGGALPER